MVRAFKCIFVLPKKNSDIYYDHYLKYYLYVFAWVTFRFNTWAERNMRVS